MINHYVMLYRDAVCFHFLIGVLYFFVKIFLRIHRIYSKQIYMECMYIV